MTQSKTVYFLDYPSQGKSRSGLTIPFPDEESHAYSRVSSLSSMSLRELIGHDTFVSLDRAAKAAGHPIATFAREAIVRSLMSKPADHDVNSIQSTFKGGRGSPLHDWYPYLEGYSPAFVQNIIRQYASDARSILDPFCGSGTTALVSASMARIGYFSEVNPVCRFVIETKAKALTLSDDARDRVATILDDIGSRIGTLIRKSPPSQELKQRLNETLGTRAVFDPRTLDLVLRLRSYLDSIQGEQPEVAPFLAMAALRSLVPCSLMVRRGDLRFRTAAELAGFRASLVDEMRSSIELISSDLRDVSEAPEGVRFVCNNARDIADHFDASIDAVITSPPYLNGTNYFRNTKIELCFLGFLKSKGDLRSFRDQAITAGINDVTVTKTKGGESRKLPDTLQGTLKALSKAAYDIRIPAMVQSYFQEMDVVSESLSRVIRPGGIAAIDLGDSCYGGVHVPTDVILADMMEHKGFRLEERIVLRERQSRDGGRLSQTLQIFERRKSTKRAKPQAAKRQDAAWARFRKDLPHQKGEMAKRNWGHPWHSLCSYQGKLKPSIASSLVAALMPEDRRGRLLDPFSGVGTVPFEGRLGGHETFGFDISPAAVIISRAKLGEPNVDEARATVDRLRKWISQPKNRRVSREVLEGIRFNGPLEDYFNTKTLGEIMAARSFFQTYQPVSSSEALVMACLLHILHGNRPYALSRRSHPITPFAPTGPSEYRSLIERLNDKLERSLAQLPAVDVPEGRIFTQDATLEWPDDVDDLDAIITSPPFFDSTRFHTANWMRLWFAGWDARDFATAPKGFVDERQKQGFDVYDSIFRQASERLRPGGVMAVHLGKSKKCDMAAALSGIGKRYLDLMDSFAESVEHCESHGLKDKGTVTHHQYLLFRR